MIQFLIHLRLISVNSTEKIKNVLVTHKIILTIFLECVEVYEFQVF